MTAPLLTTDLPLPVRRGKVRDVYDCGDALLLVATDRISAFDCVMPNGIPDKGKLLTRLSLFWFDRTKDVVANHVLSADPADFPAEARPFADHLAGRSVLVKKTAVIPYECVARGYLAGSGWKEYQQSGTLAGVTMPPDLRLADKLSRPQFTPATKADTGHDENISFAEMSRRPDVAASAKTLQNLTLQLYKDAAAYAATRGILLADTKFEFGRLPDGKVIVIDEMLTPDSSRYWPADEWEPGSEPSSFDKQFVRTFLEHEPWDKTPPAPPLPGHVIEGTRRRYVEAYERLTGQTWNG